MHKKPVSESALFHPRAILAFLLCSAGVLLTVASFAAINGTLTISEQNPVVEYDAGPFFQANQSPVGLGQLDSGPRCDDAAFPCDNHILTVSLPAGYSAAHPFSGVKVTMTWPETTGQADYDLYIFKNPRSDCTPNDCTQTDGSEQADYQSASGNNPEVAVIFPLADGDHKYTIRINPYQPTGETVHMKLELLPGAGSAVPGFGGADPTAPGVPRYQNFYAPSGSSAESSSGEFNIGYNPATGRIMTMNSGPVWRITPPEVQKPAKPECCEGLWEDKSSATTSIGLDPILWTDQKAGRTFVSNSTVGANAVYAYTDDDGDTYVEGGASPPNGGADHETIGSGPYPPPLDLALGTPVNQGEAVYYCSQDIVGPAACQRSDTLGASYGPGVLAYTGNTTECGGLHGHVHVAPNGTVWLPVNQCNGKQGGALSTDAGTSWQEFIVPHAISQTNGADPSVAIDSDSTVYYAYVNNEPVAPGALPEGHVHVQVSKDGGKTWINDVDLGATHGIKNAVEIEAVGGTSGRAAVGFIGTDIPGPYQDDDFTGVWYAFISTTYDGGKTWVTVNATPNDPVQSRTGVWQQGGGRQDRNLLDFDEITVDKNGRVLYGYSDGCVSAGCIAGTKPNDFVAYMRVARQTGGKTLNANYDVSTDTSAATVPKPPCLSGTRDGSKSTLTWKAPDNGGADITKYLVYRGTTAGGEDLLNPIGQTVGKTTFIDGTADPAVPDYFYIVKAINSTGTGFASNEIDLKVAASAPPENVCALSGITLFTDAAGDALIPGVGYDLLSAHLSQPFASNGVLKFVFTINTEPITATPAGSGWYIAMKVPDATVNGGFRYTGVRMDGGATPTFSSYVPSANTAGGVDGRFVGTSKPADPASNLDAANGKITIVVSAADLGLNPGDTIAGFVSGSTQSTDPGLGLPRATEVVDSMPDSLSFTGGYTVNANIICAPNGAPTAVLTASPDHGAGPLTVTLSGAASTDPDAGDTVATYNFDFGDGSSISQTSPTVSHTYNAPGEYPARLSVVDSRGLASLNTAVVPIEVNAALRNISTRGNVQTGDNVLIAGFIVTGNDPRQVIVRGIGPSARANGEPVPGALQDPVLELHDASGAAIATNDNWKTDDQTGQSQQAAVENSGIPPSDDRESAIVKTLSPGAYTAILRGKGNTTGVGLAEAYDLDPFANSKLANISTRGNVGTGDNVMIGGFVAGPANAAPTGVLIRGIGPSLTAQGVPDALQDPTLELHNADGVLVRSNDNWKDSQQADIEATGIAPSDDRESAMILDISPGNYTAVLAGKGSTVGNGLVEIYNIH